MRTGKLGELCVAEAQAWTRHPIVVNEKPEQRLAVVEAVIDERGGVSRARVTKSVTGVADQIVIASVKRWHFIPGNLCGFFVPVIQSVTVPIAERAEFTKRESLMEICGPLLAGKERMWTRSLVRPVILNKEGSRSGAQRDERWREFIGQIRPGDVVWWYHAKDVSDVRTLSAGYVIVRGCEAVALYILLIS